MASRVPPVEYVRNILTPGEDDSDLDDLLDGSRRIDGNEDVLDQRITRNAYEFYKNGLDDSGKNYIIHIGLDYATEVGGADLIRSNSNGKPEASESFYDERTGTRKAVSQCHFLEGNEIASIDRIQYNQDDTIQVSQDNDVVRIKDYDGTDKRIAIITGSVPEGRYTEEGLYATINETVRREMTAQNVDAVIEKS